MVLAGAIARLLISECLSQRVPGAGICAGGVRVEHGCLVLIPALLTILVLEEFVVGGRSSCGVPRFVIAVHRQGGLWGERCGGL